MLTIRDAGPSDSAEILELHYSGLLESGSLSADKSLDEDLFNIAEHYDGKNRRLLVAQDEENKIIGMIAIKKATDSMSEIKRMRVHSASRRMGIAQKLLDEVFRYASSVLKSDVLMLDTSEAQVAAQKLYEKNGFKIVDRKDIGGISSIIYKKSLSQHGKGS